MDRDTNARGGSGEDSTWARHARDRHLPGAQRAIAACTLGLLACARPVPGQTTGGATALVHDDRPATTKVLAPVVAALAAEVTTRSPETHLGLAIYDFATREYAGVNDDDPHVSASSAKAIWVAAAVKRVGVDPVAPYAKPIFETSSNDDATEVIKLAGPDFLNGFYANARMNRSGFTQWFGQAASNSPRLLGNENYITAKDAITFLTGVHDGSLLDATGNAALGEWLTWTPRTGFGGWLGTLLPTDVQTTLKHKAGWLPPPYEERSVNEIGLVSITNHHMYAIAILARNGANYEAEQAFVEHASCVVFRAAAARGDRECR